jgi:hypothetical protein
MGLTDREDKTSEGPWEAESQEQNSFEYHYYMKSSGVPSAGPREGLLLLKPDIRKGSSISSAIAVVRRQVDQSFSPAVQTLRANVNISY